MRPRFLRRPINRRVKSECRTISIIRGGERRIYYHSYVIIQEYPAKECTVQGTRPEREALSKEQSPRDAMRCIERNIIRHRMAAVGWLRPGQCRRSRVKGNGVASPPPTELMRKSMGD